MKKNDLITAQLSTDQEIFERVLNISRRFRSQDTSELVFEQGEFELVLNGMIGLVIRRGRRLVQLCQHLEIGLLTTDPIPVALLGAAYQYLLDEWRPLNSKLDELFDDEYSLPNGIPKNDAYYDLFSTVILIRSICNEIGKLDHLLNLEDPRGLIHEEDYDPECPIISYQLIEPRDAILQTQTIAMFIEACLTQLQNRNSISEPATPSDMEVAIQDTLQVKYDYIKERNYQALYTLYLIGQPQDREFICNKANTLFNESVTVEDISSSCSANKKLGLCNVEKRTWCITDKGINTLKYDKRFEEYPKVYKGLRTHQTK